MDQRERESLEQIDDMVWECVPDRLITILASMLVVVPVVGIIGYFIVVLT
jgi:hypothetical protein